MLGMTNVYKWVKKNGTLIWINTYQNIQFTNGKQYNYVHVKKSPCDLSNVSMQQVALG